MGKKEKQNIVLSIAGMTVSKLGSFIYTFAIGLYVLKITGSGQTFAATLMFGVLPRVILGPFIGNLTDRINKKLLVVGSDIFSGLFDGVSFYLCTERGTYHTYNLRNHSPTINLGFIFRYSIYCGSKGYCQS